MVDSNPSEEKLIPAAKSQPEQARPVREIPRPPEVQPESAGEAEPPALEPSKAGVLEKIKQAVRQKDDEQSVAKLTPEEEKEIEEIEDILEDDLKEVYVKLDPQTQQTFRQQGEETAKEIVGLLHRVKIKTRAIIKLIVKWLRIIPGISSFFIVKEAKIKTDKIIEMHEQEHAKKETDNHN